MLASAFFVIKRKKIYIKATKFLLTANKYYFTFNSTIKYTITSTQQIQLKTVREITQEGLPNWFKQNCYKLTF